ncbi:MAG: DoxX family protein [Acidimicrobiales bacterium]
MDIVLIIGRVLFALMLVTGGLNHFTKAEAMAGYAAHKGVPQPKLANLVSGLMLLLGGLSIILGVWADLGALVSAVVLLAMAVMMHDFWKADDQAKQMETISFFKNVSMAGGALVMFAALAAADKGVRVIGPMITDGLFQK